MDRTATMVRGLVAGLLMLGALVVVASSGTVKAYPGAASAQPPETITTVAEQRQAVVQELVSAGSDTERPCGRNGSTPGLTRCSTVQCITVCGGLPTATFTVPPPSAGAAIHIFVTDDLSRGISTIPDLPPPRPSV